MGTQQIAPTEPQAEELEECDRCYGSGMYYGAGYVENGVFKGYSGPCYRCKGKGKCTRIQNDMGNRAMERNIRWSE